MDAHDVVLPDPHRHEERGQRRSGVFAARGHDYRADLLPFFHRVLGLQASPNSSTRFTVGSRHAELFRSRWATNHKASDKGLAAEVLSRLIREERAAGRDTDERLLELVRAVAMEESDAGGAAIA